MENYTVEELVELIASKYSGFGEYTTTEVCAILEDGRKKLIESGYKPKDATAEVMDRLRAKYYACIGETRSEYEIKTLKDKLLVKHCYVDIYKRVSKSDPILKDYKFICRLVRTSPNVLPHLCQEYSMDRNLVKIAVKKKSRVLSYLDVSFRDNKKIMLMAIQADDQAMFYASKRLTQDRDIVLTAVKKRGTMIRDTPFTDDPEIVWEAVNNCPDAIADVHPRFKKSKEYAIICVKYRYGLLKHFESLTADPEIALLAIENSAVAIKIISVDLRWNKDFMLKAAAIDGMVLNHMDKSPNSMKNDKDVVRVALSTSGVQVFKYASPKLKSNHKFVKSLLVQYPGLYEYIGSDLKKDKELLYLALQNDKCALKDASSELKKDQELVMFSVQRYGFSIVYADQTLQDDYTIALTAVQDCPSVIKSLSPTLSSDIRLLKIVLEKDSRALSYLDPIYRQDYNFVLMAIKSNWKAIMYADASLRKNKLVRKWAIYSANGIPWKMLVNYHGLKCDKSQLNFMSAFKTGNQVGFQPMGEQADIRINYLF